ncbi:MAG TPA: spore protease YyaC [Cerasibacillus sp.]|uniref:spore protease YyaC n=1 Tax=Cerasibacillus sp. TaxID=2498711 RepID=UPI002F4215AD
MSQSLYNQHNDQHDSLRIHYTHPHASHLLYQQLSNWLPKAPRDYVIACIGTDRSTGDALGPFVGTYLHEINLKQITVYGTLQEPIHATNLWDAINHINQSHQRPFIIAVDASLGQKTSIGQLVAKKGALKPGAALNKMLPPIGDLYIAGIVNVSGFMEYAVLQNTRLAVVVEMAKTVAKALEKLDHQLTCAQSSYPHQYK